MKAFIKETVSTSYEVAVEWTKDDVSSGRAKKFVADPYNDLTIAHLLRQGDAVKLNTVRSYELIIVEDA